MTDFSPSIPYPLGGTLNLADNPETIADDQAIELLNIRFPGARRWSPRKAAAELFGSFSSLCGIHAMPHGADVSTGAANGCVYLDHTGGAVVLYAADGRGRNPTAVGTLAGWGAVGLRPRTLAAVAGDCLWICDESKLHGLTVYDPTERFGAGKLFQPQFQFDLTSGGPGPILCRAVEAYANFLFVAGYGTEAEPDRPNILRWSYLGFEADIEGGGDAGVENAPVFGDPNYDTEADHAPGSRGLFDIEDQVGVGPSGQPIVGMKRGGARMVVTTRFGAYLAFGYSRDSFRIDLIDNQRGCVAGRAMGEADGRVYWWSPPGPSMWAGGDRVVSLERLITPRVKVADFNSMIFAHQPEEYEVRWYYTVDAGDPNYSLAWNYLYEKWKEELLGIRVYCTGMTQPGTILRPDPLPPNVIGPGPGPGGPPPEVDPDLNPPTNLNHGQFTQHTALATWTNGETGPTIVTRVYRRPDTGVYGAPSIVESGVFAFAHGGLLEATTYWTKVEHFDTATGKVSASIEASFQTSGAGSMNPPQFLFHLPFLEFNPDGSPRIVMVWSWNLGQADVYTQVQLKRQGEDWSNATSYRSGFNATSVSEGNFPQEGQWVSRARHTSTPNYDEVLAPAGEASDWGFEIPFDAAAWIAANGV